MSGGPVGPGAEGLAAWRREFPILASTTYLISNSLGADECDAVIAEIAALAAGRPGLRATRH